MRHPPSAILKSKQGTMEMKKRKLNPLAILLLGILSLFCSSEEEKILSKVGTPGDRDLATTHYEAAHKIHVAGEDLAQAKSLYLKAFEADPSWWRPLYQLGCVHSLLGETNQSLTFLKAALKADTNPELLRYLDTDTDLAAVRKDPAFPELKRSAFGDYSSVIDKELSCAATSTMTDGHEETMTRILHGNGKITGKDFAPDFYGSSMNHYSFQGGTWKLEGKKLILTELYRHDFSSVAHMQDQVGETEPREKTYESLAEFQKEFSKPKCDVDSTF